MVYSLPQKTTSGRSLRRACRAVSHPSCRQRRSLGIDPKPGAERHPLPVPPYHQLLSRSQILGTRRIETPFWHFVPIETLRSIGITVLGDDHLYFYDIPIRFRRRISSFKYIYPKICPRGHG